MQIISSCAVFCMLILTVFTAQGNKHQAISSPANVTAVPGICALVSCTLTSPDNAKSITLCKCVNNKKEKCQTANLENERIKMLEFDQNTKNCSFIIKNITADDEGEYDFTAKTQPITCNPRLKIIIQDKPVIEVPPLREREQANLSCSAPSPCPETPPNITWWITKRNGEITEVKNENISTTYGVFYNSTLTLTPTSELHNATVGCNVSYGDKKNISTNKTIEVMHGPILKILGNNPVNEGDTLRLSCTVDSHPASSNPVWTLNVTTDKLMNHTSDGNLTITNVSTQHAGEYVCTVKYMDMPWNTSININVVRHTNADDEDMTLCITRDITVMLSFLTGMAISAIIFSVVLCCNESYKRSKTYEMMDTNIETTVAMEVFNDQEKRLHKQW